jgi:hypothetical protein
VQGTGMDASFIIGSTRGTGTVYAAVSKDPFHFDTFRNGALWSLTALPDTARNINAEAVLTDVVQRMATAGGRFDYDLVTYSVTPHHAHDNTYANGQPNGGGYAMPPDWGPYGPYDGAYDPGYGPGYGFAPWYAYNPWFYNPWFYSPGFGFGFGVGFGFGFGGCFGGCGFVGFVPGFVPFTPFPHRPVFLAPVVVGYRPRATIFAAHTLVPARFGGVGYAAHTGFVARPAVFANAHLTTAPGGMGHSTLYRSPAAATVFHQTRSTGPAFTPGMGRVVPSGDLAHAYRATPVGPAEHMSAGRPMGGAPVATRVGGAVGEPMMRGPSQAEAMRAPARAYRVEPQERSGGEGYEAPRGGGGAEAPHGSAGGGGRAPRSSGGGGWGGGGRSGGGGGGHARMTSWGGGHAGGGHAGGGHGGGHR